MPPLKTGRAPSVAVIGAGLQGATVALELARCGARVTLFVAAPAPMNRASRWNEGKLHLGYIFANDPSQRTATLMIEGATRFAPVLERFLPAETLNGNVTAGFDYLVMPDSLLSPEALRRHYAKVTRAANAVLDGPGRSYTGGRRRLEVRAMTAAEAGRYGPEARGFVTDEIGVDTWAIADGLVAASDAAPNIELVADTKVERVDWAGHALTMTIEGQREGPFDHVVNASWDGRLALDATLDIRPTRGHVWRLKRALQITSSATERLPTVTMVLGAFGDIVPFPNGHAYLSWYPAGCLARSDACATPEDWGDPMRSEEIARVIAQTVDALDAIVPGVRDIVGDSDVALDGGVIFTWGDVVKDVDHPASEFHQRSDVGITTHGERYHSIDTGKYTLAPHFADLAANRILSI